MKRTLEFTHGGANYKVAFEHRAQKTKNLIKRGILHRSKHPLPDLLRCTHCTVSRNNQPIATGLAVCSPADKYDSRTGRKTALQKTIQIYRRQYHVAHDRMERQIRGGHLNKDWATEAWYHLFAAETPDARACRRRNS